jgi:hypothetical protein
MAMRASPTRWLAGKAPLLGAAGGAWIYLACLAVQVLYSGAVRPAFGCSPPLGYSVVNLPAEALEIVIPNDALAPQQFGEHEDRGRSAKWSPTGFVALGATFYAVVGLACGSVAYVVLRNRAAAA